jgi:ribonuclease J
MGDPQIVYRGECLEERLWSETRTPLTIGAQLCDDSAGANLAYPLAIDGDRLVAMQGGVMAARRRMLGNGVVIGSIAVDRAGILRGAPRIIAPGLFEPDDAGLVALAEDFADGFADLPESVRRNPQALNEAAESTLRRVLGRRFGKKPMVNVQVISV